MEKKFPNDPGVRPEVVVALADLHLYKTVLHELQAILQGVLTDAEFLTVELNKSKPGLTTLRKDAGDLLAKVEMLVATVGNLRSSSSFRSMETTNLDSVVCNVLRLLARTAQQRSVVLEYSNEVSGRPQVAVSVGLARQVVFNLVDTAIKYSLHTEPRSVVWVSLARRRDDIELRVRNRSVPGETDVERIFEPGFSRHAALSQNPSGSGWGLSVARKLLKDNRGDVSLETTPTSSWTSFVARFPLAHKTDSEKSD